MGMYKISNRELLERFFAKNGALEKPSCDDSEDSHNVPGKSPCNRKGLFYCTVRNIPSSMRSRDLRQYFSDFTENEKFFCFHYRHRPEVQQESTDATKKSSSGARENNSDRTCCCVISFISSALRTEFIRKYHGRHWVDTEGMEIPRRCFVSAIKVADNCEGTSNSLTINDLRQMIELRPPSVMPRGNVGTPTRFFMEQIRLCRLPLSLIPKLGLKTTRRKRKYDSVEFYYDSKDDSEETEFIPQKECGTVGDKNSSDDNKRRFLKEETLQKDDQFGGEQPSASDPTEEFIRIRNEPDNDSFPDDDDDQCEEWERHEALHDDVTEQDRIKPRKYEEEMEIIWEKGGPGLVWYTDKNYWDEREKGTDCDWAWADDWDVDYSVYYEGKSMGSKDARDAIEIREDEVKRSGMLEDSVFTKKVAFLEPRRRRRSSENDAVEFEKYTKGVGSKLLGRMGWKPGLGLGRSQQGRIDPVAIHLEEDSQLGSDRKGFGYRGEKLQRTGFLKVPKVHAIASSFDTATDMRVAPYKRVENERRGEILFRRAELTKMKYRTEPYKK